MFNNLKKLAIEYGIEEELVNSITISYNDKCNSDSGIMGKYNHFSKSIDLMKVDDELIFPTYIHELVHAMQHKVLGTIRYILALSFLRYRLEKDADNVEKYAEEWMISRNKSNV